jgi:hypothetical protein
MGPGSHVGFPISAKNKKFVYDHPMNISAKFGSNLFCGFRKKDENVKKLNFKEISCILMLGALTIHMIFFHHHM